LEVTDLKEYRSHTSAWLDVAWCVTLCARVLLSPTQALKRMLLVLDGYEYEIESLVQKLVAGTADQEKVGSVEVDLVPHTKRRHF
jgi:hypothetical protein